MNEILWRTIKPHNWSSDSTRVIISKRQKKNFPRRLWTRPTNREDKLTLFKRVHGARKVGRKVFSEEKHSKVWGESLTMLETAQLYRNSWNLARPVTSNLSKARTFCCSFTVCFGPGLYWWCLNRVRSDQRLVYEISTVESATRIGNCKLFSLGTSSKTRKVAR